MPDTKETKVVSEYETTPEDTRELMRSYENDILGGLLAAASFKSDEEETHPVEIARNGVVLLKFRIHPLREEDYSRCREKYTKYVRNKQLGIKFPDTTDTAKYRAALIYEATVAEDQTKVWGNQEAWKRLDVLGPVDLICRVLKAGEKDTVVDLIDSISGFSMTTEEVAKN